MAKKDNSGPLDYGALCRRLKAEGTKSVYLLYGAEDYLLSDFVSRVRKECVSDGAEDFNAKRMDGAAPDPDALSDAVNMMPFLGGRTFIELRGMDVGQCRDDKYLEIFRDIPEWCTVCILAPAEKKPDARLLLTKEIAKHGEIVEFTALPDTALFPWIVRRFEAHGKTITRREIERLTFLSGNLMTQLIPEIDKICAYVPGEKITLQDVETLAHHLPEADAFAFTECLSNRNYDGAARLVTELLESDHNAIEIFGALGWQLRQLYGLKLAEHLHRGSAAAGEALGLYSYRLRRFADTAHSFSLKGLSSALRMCAEYDYKLKTSSGEDLEILKDFMVRFIMEERCAANS